MPSSAVKLELLNRCTASRSQIWDIGLGRCLLTASGTRLPALSRALYEAPIARWTNSGSLRQPRSTFQRLGTTAETLLLGS